MAHHHTRKLAERSETGDEGINRACRWAADWSRKKQAIKTNKKRIGGEKIIAN